MSTIRVHEIPLREDGAISESKRVLSDESVIRAGMSLAHARTFSEVVELYRSVAQMIDLRTFPWKPVFEFPRTDGSEDYRYSNVTRGSFYIQITIDVNFRPSEPGEPPALSCAYRDAAPRVTFSRIEPFTFGISPARVLQRLRYHLQHVVLHELDEHLMIGGYRLFDPHADEYTSSPK